MLKLLRRDLDWLVTASLLILVIETAFLFELPQFLLFELPDGMVANELLHLQFVLGLVLGLVVALREGLARTGDWFAHRPVSALRLALARHVHALGVLALGFLLPLLLRRLLTTGHDLALLGGTEQVLIDEPGRWGELIALGTVAFSGYGLVVLARALPTPRLVRVVSGVVAAGIWLWFCRLSMSRDLRLSAVGFAMLQIGMTTLCLALAHGCRRPAVDPDRPGRALAPPLALGLTAVAFILLMGCMAELGQAGPATRLAHLRPEIHWRDGRFALVGRDDVDPMRPRQTRRILLDDREQRVADADPGWTSVASHIVPPQAGEGILGDLGGETVAAGLGHRLRTSSTHAPLVFILDLDAGTLSSHAFGDRIGRGPELPRQQYFRRPDGGRFSARSQLLVADDGRSTLVWDPRDGSLWEARFEPRVGLFPIDFPADDRIIGRSVAANVRSPGGEVAADDEAVVSFLGRSGFYRREGDRLVRDGDCDEPRHRFVAELIDDDPIAPEVLVRDREGRECFRHRYLLASVEEGDAARALAMVGLLRAPVLQVLAFARPSAFEFRARGRNAVFDPFLAGGRRGHLVLISFGLGLLLGLGQWLRLGRLGAGRRRRWVWLGAVVLGGPIVFILAFFFERPRAHRALVLPAAVPLLVGSASGTASC